MSITLPATAPQPGRAAREVDQPVEENDWEEIAQQIHHLWGVRCGSRVTWQDADPPETLGSGTVEYRSPVYARVGRYLGSADPHAHELRLAFRFESVDITRVVWTIERIDADASSPQIGQVNNGGTQTAPGIVDEVTTVERPDVHQGGQVSNARRPLRHTLKIESGGADIYPPMIVETLTTNSGDLPRR